MKTKPSNTPIFFVGTRFQAVMAHSIIRHLNIHDFDVVIFSRTSRLVQSQDAAIESLVKNARNRFYINRQSGSISQFLKLSLCVGPRKRTVFLAQVSNGFIITVFKIFPILRMRTFDEGAYNFLVNGPFFKPSEKTVGSYPRRIFLNLLFPSSVLDFVKTRTEIHYTFSRPEENIFSDKCEKVQVSWSKFCLSSEKNKFREVTTILVLPCFADLADPVKTFKLAQKKAEECDLVVRHPRDPELEKLPALRLVSPIEAIIDVARQNGEVVVFHFDSTVGLTVRDWENVKIVNVAGN